MERVINIALGICGATAGHVDNKLLHIVSIKFFALLYTHVFHLTVICFLSGEQVLEPNVVVLVRCSRPNIFHRLVRTVEGLFDVDLNVAFFCDELSDDIFRVKVLKPDPRAAAGTDILLIFTFDGH